MSIVQRIHEKVRIYLVLQILQLLVQVFVFKLLQFLFVLFLLEQQFYSEIHAKHENKDNNRNKVELVNHEWTVSRSTVRKFIILWCRGHIIV